MTMAQLVAVDSGNEVVNEQGEWIGSVADFNDVEGIVLDSHY